MISLITLKGSNLFIQDYFSRFQSLWTEFVNMVYAKIPYESLFVVQEIYGQSKTNQYFMKPHPGFEAIH